MTYPKKEITVACSYLLRLMKAHVKLSPEQINVFKQTFHEILSKRYIGHWFPATPHRGSAYRCLQTKHWKDPVLRSIAERSRLPLHRYLPAIFTIWIDPGEVAVCFGDEGTWCPLYKHGMNGEIQQSYSDGEETASSLVSDDDFSSLTENIQNLNLDTKHAPSTLLPTQTTDSRPSSSLASSSRASSPYLTTMATNLNTQIQGMNDCQYFRSNDWKMQEKNFWMQERQSTTMADGLFQVENL